MKKLLLATAVIESGAGLALMWRPSWAVALLVGSPLIAPAAVTLGRVTGVALFALGVACWLAHHDQQSCAASGLVTAMVFYNLGAAVVLSVAGLRSQTAGAALWLTVVLHAVMAVCCVTSLLRTVEINNTSALTPGQQKG